MFAANEYHGAVLSSKLQIVDIDGNHWNHWYELLVPSRVRTDPRFGILFLSDGAPVKLVIRGRGEISLDRISFDKPTRPTLARLARTLDVHVLVAIEHRIIPDVMSDIERQLDIADDYVAQALHALRALQPYRDNGIWSEPPLLHLIPPVSYERLQKTFDTLIADNTSLIAYVFEDDGSDVHASLILSKRGGHIALATTHRGVQDALPGPDLARDWRKNYRRLVRVVGQRYDPPSLALFIDRKTYMRILVGPPDQLGREIGRRNVVLDPAPAWLLGLLGSATMAAVAGRGAKALTRMLPERARLAARNLSRTAQSVMRESGAHPFALLGFDPIALWHQLRGMYQP